jgi:hypothetical protein
MVLVQRVPGGSTRQCTRLTDNDSSLYILDSTTCVPVWFCGCTGVTYRPFENAWHLHGTWMAVSVRLQRQLFYWYRRASKVGDVFRGTAPVLAIPFGGRSSFMFSSFEAAVDLRFAGRSGLRRSKVIKDSQCNHDFLRS